MLFSKEKNTDYDEWIKQSKKNSFRHWLLAKSIGFAIRIPLLATLVMRSFGLMCFYISVVHRQGRYTYLYRFIIKILKSSAYRKGQKTPQWWFFMHLIVAFMQEQQIRSLLIFPEIEEELIVLGRDGPEPKFGYHVAYCFVGFSLWMFERGAVSEAVTMVERAAEGDPTWGYPEYLIGWYGLFTEGVDSVTHFTNAVLLDWNFLHRLKKDRTCQQFPDILREVHKNVLISEDAEPDNKLKE